MDSQRIWEIDFLRGVAIILMSLFHLLYDLSEFYGFNIDYTTGIVDLIGETSALMFILLTGISCALSRSNIRRGLKILFFAMIITVVTYIYDTDTYINFGILHLIGTSIFLYYVFKDLNSLWLIVIGTFIILLGNYFDGIAVNTNFFVPLGLTTAYYASLDFYPLFPYFGVFLYGVALRKIVYPSKKSIFNFSWEKSPVNSLGQHSLLIYLTHQPVFLVLLVLMQRLGLIS
ncbi:MAG: heparan-alpha-glucosaminide N-acetyltransferase [Bacillota bacterium]